MTSKNTKEIEVDVVLAVIVKQRFQVPVDYEFGKYENQYQFVNLSSYLKLLIDHGTKMPNLTEIRDLEDIDTRDVIDVYFQGIADVNVEECVDIRVVSQS
jgi:hypothetical protein